MTGLTHYSMHYCAITAFAGRHRETTTMRMLSPLPTDVDDAAGDYWGIIAFDADVRYTRVKLDEDLLQNCMMHHTVKRERGWVRDRCLMVVILEMLTPFHRWTNNWMRKYFHYHCPCYLESLVNYFVQIHRDHR